MLSTSTPYLYCTKTDKGLTRSNNEDSFLELPEQGIWAVADGMGGHASGEIASKITVDTLKAAYTQSGKHNSTSLNDALLEAHNRVLLEAKENGKFGMGSTAVVLKSISEEEYEIAWVGDSRAYSWIRTSNNDGELFQLTTDHSLVQALIESNLITQEEANKHPEKHVITQCLGTRDKNIAIDKISAKWRPNEWLLLCSDGLTNELSDQEIANQLVQTDDIEIAAKLLLRAALNAGGKDNITLQIISRPKNVGPSSWLKQMTSSLFKNS